MILFPLSFSNSHSPTFNIIDYWIFKGYPSNFYYQVLALFKLDYSNIPHRIYSLFLSDHCSLISHIAIPVCYNNSQMATPGIQVILFITRTVSMDMLQYMGCKELDMTEQLNNNGSYYTVSYRSPRRGLWIERET